MLQRPFGKFGASHEGDPNSRIFSARVERLNASGNHKLLIAASEAVFHILGPDHVARDFITTAAKLGPGKVLTYPVEV